jgi:glycosyltransferase involved in cell wall biosynthesis
MESPVKKVSILLSCFNASDHIEDYIESLLLDEITSICTLVAVNFPHSHADPQWVERQLCRYPDLILLNQDTTVSLYEAWNLAVQSSDTEFVGNLNLDDRVDADYYAFALDQLERYKADVFSSASIMTQEIGTVSAKHAHEQHLDAEQFDERGIAQYGVADLVGFNKGRLLKRNPPHCAPVWRRSLHDELGYFDSRSFDFAADYEFWLRAASAQKKFINSKLYKTLFFSSEGTASDRLQHGENSRIIKYWEPSFPKADYSSSRLGEQHFKIHHCLNLNCIFSSRDYFNHLSEDLVSIIVVAHDRPELLLECLESIRSQSYPLFECIVVLDADGDGVLRESVKRQYEHDARFLQLSLSGKRERNYCRNLGLALATGRWVTIVDGDDLLPPDSLAIRVAAAVKQPGNIVFGRMLARGENGQAETIQFADKYDFHDLRISWPAHCTLLIDRSLLLNTRYPAASSDCDSDPSLIAGEDVRFMFDLLKDNPGVQFVNTREHVYTYRRHFSSSYVKRHRSVMQVIGTIIDYHGEPAEDDLSFKKSMAERAVGYLFWCAFSKSQNKEMGELKELADPDILKLALNAAPSVIEKARERFLAEVRKLGVFDERETTQISTSIQHVLDAPTEAPPASHYGPKSRPMNCARFDPSKIDYSRLGRWKNHHMGEDCILMCNGPGLGKVDFSRINTSRFCLFGLNKIFLGFDQFGMAPKYIVAINGKVIEQSVDTYSDLGIVKFLSNRADPVALPQSPFNYYLNTARLPANAKRFSRNIVEYVNEGWTVTHAALQIIHYMGFSNVFIIGMDHCFSRHIQGQENQARIMHGEDTDHFHPDYFGHGQTWDLPDLENSEISYRSALAAYQDDDRQIFDCSIDGACTIFPKLDVDALYSSSIVAASSAQGPEFAPAEQTPATRTRKICYFPAFEAEDDINFSMIRAAWSLGCVPDVEITVFTDSMPPSLACHDYYDPACQRAYQELRDSGQLLDRPYADPEDLLPHLHDAEIIVCWKEGSYIENLLGTETVRELLDKGKTIYRVGAGNQNESSIYIEISKDLLAFEPELISENRGKFMRLVERLGGRDNAYLFATGPSSQAYSKYLYDSESDLSIICNSVINDADMLATVKPDILVFADPIFHFAWSSYARAFRQKLLEAARLYAFDIIIPIKYYPIFTFHVPELRDRVIGIPHYKDRGINLDLAREFYLHTQNNILTYLMLPVGASLARNLYLIGCDGKLLAEDEYFWGHNQKTQFTGEMEAIQKAHPSFFKVDYSEYYLAHCQQLENYAQAIEYSGHRLYSMWGSHIPALSKRLCVPKHTSADRVVVSINPDLKDNFGHWAHYDRRLAETTPDLVLALANRKLSTNPVEFFAVPSFTDDVFAIKNQYTPQSRLRLENEFRDVVDQVLAQLDANTRLDFIMYSGDVTYVEALDEIFQQLAPRASLSLNLFYAHFDFDVDSGAFARHEQLYERILSHDYLQSRPWLRLFTDSEKMQSLIRKHYGLDISLWPMVNLDIDDSLLEQIGPKPARKEKLVVFPGNGQLAKGFDLACDFIARYGERLANTHGCRFVLRKMFRDSAHNNQLMSEKLEQIAEMDCVEIIEGTVSEIEFLRLFCHAEVVVLPYRRKNFYSRTSSCVVNAILTGTPALVPEDTWLADQVRNFGAGGAFTDGNIESLYAALVHLLDQPSDLPDVQAARAHFSSGKILPTVTTA